MDMLIHVRCAPGHSWTNPAERIMNILNIGLQNVSLERKEAGREIEMLLKGLVAIQCLKSERNVPQMPLCVKVGLNLWNHYNH